MEKWMEVFSKFKFIRSVNLSAWACCRNAYLSLLLKIFASFGQIFLLQLVKYL